MTNKHFSRSSRQKSLEKEGSARRAATLGAGRNGKVRDRPASISDWPWPQPQAGSSRGGASASGGGGGGNLNIPQTSAGSTPSF